MANPDEFARTPEQQARGRALCLAEAGRWRGQASILRECAAQACHAPDERAVLPLLLAGAEATAHLWRMLGSRGVR